jgi:hypothetical protein
MGKAHTNLMALVGVQPFMHELPSRGKPQLVFKFFDGERTLVDVAFALAGQQPGLQIMMDHAC